MHVIISPFISSFPLKSKFALKNNFSFFLIIFFHFFYLLLIFIDLFSFSFLPFLLSLEKAVDFLLCISWRDQFNHFNVCSGVCSRVCSGFEINTFFFPILNRLYKDTKHQRDPRQIQSTGVHFI